MKRPYARRQPGFGDSGVDAEERGRRANRRRFTVFAAVFVVVAIVGLVYDFSRPAIYEATARLNFVPATAQRADNAAQASSSQFSLRDEVEFLTSRPLLATVWERLKTTSAPLPVISEADPASSLQAMLSATQVPGTNVVLLQARGRQPAFLAAFLDRLVAAYRVSLADRYRSASTGTLSDVGDEAKKLEATVLAKRQEADAFRARYNIVSLERDENQILSEVKGTTAALNAANDKVVAAETRLNTLQDAQAAGQSVTRARDNPTLVSLEQQAIAIRAELREVARTFTPEYMKIDPRIRSLRERLAEIDQQIVAQRQTSQQGALQEAREEVSSSRAAVATLRRQLSTNQQSVQSFTSRFNEYRALQEELARVEQLRQKAVERQAALEAEDSGRTPKVEAVEAASIPGSPASPLYVRDAAIAVIGALLAGLVTMGIVELFNRPPRQPAAVIVQQAWSPVAMGRHDGPALASNPSHGLLEAATVPTAVPALAAPLSLPRELATSELAALLDNAGRDLRAAIALLLMGLTRADVVGLRRADVDRASGSVHAGGSPGRQVALPPQVVGMLPGNDAAAGPADAPLLAARNGAPMTEADLDAALLYAAHDAGLDEPDEVDAAALHHTYVAFLVRQGVRFSELVDLVGALRAEALADYRQLAPAGARRSMDSVDRVMPVLREPAAG